MGWPATKSCLFLNKFIWLQYYFEESNFWKMKKIWMRLLLRSDSRLSYPNSSLIYCSNSSHDVHISHGKSGQDLMAVCLITDCVCASSPTCQNSNHQPFPYLQPQIRTLKEYSAGSIAVLLAPPYINIHFHLLLHQQKFRRQVRIKSCFQKNLPKWERLPVFIK